MANIQVQTPKNFNFKNPDSWPSWQKRFEQFCVASGLSATDETRQVSMLLYCIGPEAESVLDSTNATEEERKKYSTVLAKFDSFFKVRKNTIFELAKFNRHRQQEGETAEQFIAALFDLAENCEYGNLKDELIRDRLVVGIVDSSLSERLQMDSELTLAKAMTVIRQQEAVRSQQSVLHKPIEEQLGSLRSAKSQKPTGKSRKSQSGNTSEHKTCSRCGKGSHSRDKCPAKDATCFKCQKKGHFSLQCFSKEKAGQDSVYVDTSADSTHSTHDSDSTTFLDVIHTGNKTVWTATLKVNDQEVVFKLDTGAEVTAISDTVYKNLSNISLQKP